MRFQAVIFDFDGVIVDTEVTFVRALHEFLERMGLSHDPDEALKYTGLPPVEIISQIRRNLSNSEKYSETELMEGLQEMYTKVIGQAEVIPMKGFQKFYDRLKENGVKVALGTSRDADNAEELMKSAGLDLEFDVAVTHKDITHPKPHPETFILAAEKLAEMGISENEILILEDSFNGIQAGKASGIFVVGFKGSEVVQNTSHADIECNSYEEVERFFFGS